MHGITISNMAKVDLWLDDMAAPEYGVQPIAADWSRIAAIATAAGEVAAEFEHYRASNPYAGDGPDFMPVMRALSNVVLTAICTMNHFTKSEVTTGAIMADVETKYVREMMNAHHAWRKTQLQRTPAAVEAQRNLAATLDS